MERFTNGVDVAFKYIVSEKRRLTEMIKPRKQTPIIKVLYELIFRSSIIVSLE